MKVIPSTLLLILSTFLLSFSGLATLLATPNASDSRGIFIIALGAAGLVLGAMAILQLKKLNRLLVAQQTA
ncbi:hypothetical protein [Pseudoalteromonas sp. BDTF-M6]|uniref:hypothetical protein n=1 Tax=Pseudoalteromonas sp. BDTF-M6 TaxID=2796132 RepID=UPI001BAF7306|nr:hypothetical protein [Pseudoalteromonas sp. BDTF-M6]MBS3796643.1 hypothetical protein [Pseudoalteromonas sp. BDTF-M6]